MYSEEYRRDRQKVNKEIAKIYIKNQFSMINVSRNIKVIDSVIQNKK